MRLIYQDFTKSEIESVEYFLNGFVTITYIY